MLKSLLLFYKRLVVNLESIGFKSNPYNLCVANKMIDGKKMTIVWHVDDLKASHVDTNIVTEITEWLKSTYGDLKVNCGKKHKYLGMDLDFTLPGEVKISMIPYVQNILNKFLEEIGKSASNPAADHLFWVREEQDLRHLPEEQALAFHHMTA